MNKENKKEYNTNILISKIQMVKNIIENFNTNKYIRKKAIIIMKGI